MTKPPVIAYLMSRFPKITETFVLYEILELRRRGLRVEIFPLLRERAKTVHPEVVGLMPSVHFRPFLAWRYLSDHLYFLRRKPGHYLRALWEVLAGTWGSANFFFGALAIFPKCVSLARTMEGMGVTAIHAHFANHPALAALLIHRLTAIPFSFTAHGSDIHVEQRMVDRKIRAARFVVMISRYNMEFIAARFGDALKEKMRLVRCGTDPELFRPLEPPARGEVFTLFCAAALREVKGHRVLIEACALLKAEGVDFRCLLAGEGPYRRRIAHQIQRLGLTREVTLLGPLPRMEVVEGMRRADVVVLASILGSRGDREGVPVVLMEAMACEKAVVASRLSGIPELVEDGVGGLLFPPGDARALADQLLALAADPGWRARLGREGRRRVEAEFDLRKNAGQLAELLLEPTPHPGRQQDADGGDRDGPRKG